jgi:hypothetical protein
MGSGSSGVLRNPDEDVPSLLGKLHARRSGVASSGITVHSASARAELSAHGILEGDP